MTTQQDLKKELPIDWSAADGEPVQPANQFVAQMGPDAHILNLGFISLPIILDPGDRARISAIKSIPVRVVARVLLTPTNMRELREVLSTHIEKFEKRKQGQEK